MPDSQRRTRGRPSRVQQLPPELKARVDELLRAGVTQAAILDRLAPLFEQVGEKPLSYSSLNRYASRMATVGDRLREAREVADAWTAKFGETPTSNVGAYTIEMLRTLVFDLVLKAQDGEVDIDKVQEIALSVQRIERASNLNAARERAQRKELAELAAAEAEKAAKAQIEARGGVITPETLRAIREQVYGMISEPAGRRGASSGARRGLSAGTADAIRSVVEGGSPDSDRP